MSVERLTYDFCVGGNHCWQVKGADNLECREVCERQGDNGCKTCPIAKAFDRLAAIEDILGEEYDLDHLRELVEADKDGRCVVLPFKPHKTMWSCSKSNPKPAKAYYATEMGILADMKAGCVFGETPEAAEAALAKEARP